MNPPARYLGLHLTVAVLFFLAAAVAWAVVGSGIRSLVNRSPSWE